jgi:hypothetical protein
VKAASYWPATVDDGDRNVGAINVVLITALATVGAVIYHLATHLAGGIEVTLKETG